MSIDKNNIDNIDYVQQVRPWLRYWARWIDIILFYIFIEVIRAIFFPTKQFDITFLPMGSFMIWILVEAQLLSTWGTTPGKWLLKTRVRDSSLNKLTYKTALKRSFLVWIIGLGIWIFMPLTLIISHLELRKKGITTWDKLCKSNVIHEEVETSRITVLVLIILSMYILTLASS